MGTTKIQYGGGEGFEYVSENDNYTVLYEDSEAGIRKDFNNLTEAKQFFNNLNVPKAIWCGRSLLEWYS